MSWNYNAYHQAVRDSVAPYAGAWVEMPNLKIKGFFVYVAPFADAWVEINSNKSNFSNSNSRTLCGCVSWNVCDEAGNLDAYRHTLRGCESWNYQCSPVFLRNNVAPFTGAWVEIKNRAKFIFSCSRTLYGRVSWNILKKKNVIMGLGHTLCGYVSWNDRFC